MKKICTILIFSIFTFNPFIKVLAGENTQIEQNTTYAKNEEVFIFLWKFILKDINEKYKKIELKYENINKWTDLYESLQKLVYLDIIKNTNFNFEKNDFLKKSIFTIIFNRIDEDFDLSYLSSDWYITKEELIQVFHKYEEKIKKEENEKQKLLDLEKQKMEIFNDVYKTLLNDHYEKDKISKIELLDEAIIWLTKWSWDQFTTYFPPAKNKDFMWDLQWKFYGIWAYVEMQEPWILKIISPISGSPADEAWLKAGDIVVKVNEKTITKDMSLEEAVSYIKWEKWTKVTLTIYRDQKLLEIEVTRDEITLKDVEYKVLDEEFFYIKTRMFWDNIYSEFKEALTALSEKKEVKKIIIDLRNNPGWYLDKVNKILWMFIKKWETVSIIDYQTYEIKYSSNWYNQVVDLNDYDVYILTNEWTASASEILTGTLKDYFPNIKIIWKKTYWKWSVQTIKQYKDWSSVKYTIAHWYTWKSRTWINEIWIEPDIEVEYEKIWETDSQLKYILDNF